MATGIEHLDKGDVVEIPKEEFERLVATLEFLQDEDVKKGVLKGLREYREGKSRPWSEVKEDLAG